MASVLSKHLVAVSACRHCSTSPCTAVQVEQRSVKPKDRPYRSVLVIIVAASCSDSSACMYIPTCVCRSGGHVRLAWERTLRMAKPRLFYQEGGIAAQLLPLCPVLHKDYAPPLVSLNGGMHMVLSVGELACLHDDASTACALCGMHAMPETLHDLGSIQHSQQAAAYHPVSV